MKPTRKFATGAIALAFGSLCVQIACGQAIGPTNAFDPAGDWTGTAKCERTGYGTMGSPAQVYRIAFEDVLTLAIVSKTPGLIVGTASSYLYHPQEIDFYDAGGGPYFPDADMKRGQYGFYTYSYGAARLTLSTMPSFSRINVVRTLEGQSIRSQGDGYGPFTQTCAWKLTSKTPSAS